MEAKDLVFITDKGTPATDSWRVAEFIGRQHKNIRKSCKRLIGQGFKSSFYEKNVGNRRVFIMDLRGFCLVTKTIPFIGEQFKAANRAFHEAADRAGVALPDCKSIYRTDEENAAQPAETERAAIIMSETGEIVSVEPVPERAFEIIEQSNEQFINARMLHAFLGVARDFPTWFADKVNRYGFEKGVDFDVLTVIPGNVEKVGRPAIDYLLKIDVAKELCMVEGNERGRIARKYFIEVEKRFRAMQPTAPAIPQTFAQALRLAADQAAQIEYQQKQLAAAETALAEHRDKVQFADALQTADTSIKIGDLAKLIRQNGIDTGEMRLFSWLRENGFLCLDNTPTQRALEMGLFEQKATQWRNPQTGEMNTTFTTLATVKGQKYFINKIVYKSQKP